MKGTKMDEKDDDKTKLSQVFAYGDRMVRTGGTVEAPLFRLGDVCSCLGIGNVTMATERLEEDEFSSTEVVDSAGKRQEALFVTEAGLYSLVLGSRKPEAKAFKRWVTHEVLPSIRRTGGYGTQKTPSLQEMVGALVPVLVPALMTEVRKQFEEQAAKNEFVRPWQARSIKQAISALANARTIGNPKNYRRERGSVESDLRSDFKFNGTGRRWEMFPSSRWCDMAPRIEAMHKEATRLLSRSVCQPDLFAVK